MTESRNTHNWRLDIDDDNVAWLCFDKIDGANVLSRNVLTELAEQLVAVSDKSPAGLIIYSGKDNGFIAGADISEFTQVKDKQDAFELIRHGQQVFNKLASLPFPTVAMIHGYCMGGGLELALACRYRVVSNETSTRLSLPEIKLGIHPGFGGSVRLPSKVGALAAMDMMLTGRNINARSAKRMALVDAAVPERQLRVAAKRYVLDNSMRAASIPWWTRLTNHSLIRPLLAMLFRRQVAKQAKREHYPAPYALIKLWQVYFGNTQRMLDEEAVSVANLAVTDTARNLVRVFFLREKLKSFSKQNVDDFSPQHVHVIGAGVMGGDIAAWCALKGMRVTLQDSNLDACANTMKRAYVLFDRRLKLPHLVQAAMDRLAPDIHGRCVHQADVVIEAIFEDVGAKQDLFRQLEPKLKDNALLATNTSSIRLETLGEALASPERLVGLHFFNPVAKMPLIEVVKGSSTDETVIKRAEIFAGKIDRLPLPAQSSPGFLVNRVLMPYLLEAVQLFQEGVPASVIDKAATDFGMPMGPIHLADTVGLDICLSVANILAEKLETVVPEKLRSLVENGKLGVKSGQGFYQYKGRKPISEKLDKNYKAPDNITDRLIMSFLNEAVACLREGIVEDTELLDAGIIFGTGFAPFRGGPMHYIESLGAAGCMQTLESLEKDFGSRFASDVGWNRLVMQ